MSIDLRSERLGIKEVAAMLGVSLNTIWRWCLSGCDGHKLESFRIGHQRYVTRDAVKRFIAVQNPGDDGESVAVTLPDSPPAPQSEAHAHATTTVG